MNDIVRNLRATRADMLGTEDEEHYWDCHKAAEYIEQLQAVVDTLKILELDHEISCSIIMLADKATNRWWPDCDCNIGKLHEALAALEGDDE